MPIASVPKFNDSPIADGPINVVKLRPDMVEAAIAESPENGADDIFFAIQKDTFVASAKGVDSDVLPGEEVEYQGRSGRVLYRDEQVNTAWDGVKAAFSTGKNVELGILGVGTALGVGAGMIPGAQMALPYIAGGVALASTVDFFGTVIGAVGMAAYGAFRDADLDSLEKYGQGAPENAPIIWD
jgi:hypothetical protein